MEELRPDQAVVQHVTREDALDRFRACYAKCGAATGRYTNLDVRPIREHYVDKYGFGYSWERGKQTYQFRGVQKPVVEVKGGVFRTTYSVRLYDSRGYDFERLLFDTDKQNAEIFAEALSILAEKDRRGD
jgi:hypothetical protein